MMIEYERALILRAGSLYGAINALKKIKKAGGHPVDRDA